jgi:hypothetical protein
LNKTVRVNSTGDFLLAIWEKIEPGEYDVVADVNGDGYFNLTDVVDGISGEPGFSVVEQETAEISFNNIEFGDITANESCYYYPSHSGTKCVSDDIPASDIQPFASVDFMKDEGCVLICLGANMSLPQSSQIIH